MKLELESVTAGYGGVLALRDVSLVVPDGRIAALLGPNGAGRTTLLSVASGLVRAQTGRTRLGAQDISDWATERRAAAGLCHVTEGRAIFPSLSVGDNLRMFTAPRDEAEALERAVEAFPTLGQRMHQLAGTMSGGEQQMLALARAYGLNAPVVLLDEVSMGLAPMVVEEIFRFLARLRSEGHTLLLVEQYVTKALELADIVYVIVRGRMVFAGEPAELTGSDVFTHYLGTEAVGS